MKASDLNGPVTTRIVDISPVKVKDTDKTEKLVATLEGQEKKLVLNATNVGVLRQRFGDDYSAWVGKGITLASVAATYQGQATMGVRIIG